MIITVHVIDAGLLEKHGLLLNIIKINNHKDEMIMTIAKNIVKSL